MRSILHVDMDAFYASIEQLDHPEYKGRPVIVGADPRNGKGRGVVAACSYEARKFGVRSALPIRRAWKLCPEGVYVRPRMKRYVEVSHQVMDVFRRYTDLVEPLSIDEAFLDITGSTALLGAPDKIAQSIKKEIRETTGLTASIGLGAHLNFETVEVHLLGREGGGTDLDPDRIVNVGMHQVSDGALNRCRKQHRRISA